MIPFNIPCFTGNEQRYISQVIFNKKFSGDGEFTRKCHQWLETSLNCSKTLLTTSGTHALEMAAILANIKEGDEVIMPSYTFTSSANAFVLRGARIVFVDIRPDTMNIDETLIEAAITEKTRVIVPVHYGGVACEMDTIMTLANKYGLIVIEDAAQAILSTYKGRYLGTIGHFGCLSFHETKNIQCGEGGALLINNEQYFEQAEIIREKGTNRSKFFRGEINKYGWVEMGSSYLPSELNAAFLYAQLEMAEIIIENRILNYNHYINNLSFLTYNDLLEIQTIPDNCNNNGHIIYIKLKDIAERQDMINYLKDNGVSSVFHYIPLHSSQAGEKYSLFSGTDKFTTKDSERLLRLPLYYNLEEEKIDYICDKINTFMKSFI